MSPEPNPRTRALWLIFAAVAAWLLLVGLPIAAGYFLATVDEEIARAR